MKQYMNVPVETDRISMLLGDYKAGIQMKELKKIYLLSLADIRKILKENRAAV